MVLADIGLGQLIWTTWILFMLAALVWVIIVVVRDLFRNRELSGWAKAGWLAALILFPLLGSLVYIIVRGLWLGTGEDAAARAQLTRTEFERREGGVADSTGTGPGGPSIGAPAPPQEQPDAPVPTVPPS
jgi:Phospholipase_D-nuclease N-terminal